MLAVLMLASGCVTTQFVCNPVDKAPRPVLIPLPQSLRQTVGPEAQDVWTLNDLALKEAIRTNEANIDAHNETCGT